MRPASMTSGCPQVTGLNGSVASALDSTAFEVARDVNLPTTRLHEIVHERRGVTAKTAIALGAYFGQTPEFWMNVQTA